MNLSGSTVRRTGFGTCHAASEARAVTTKSTKRARSSITQRSVLGTLVPDPSRYGGPPLVFEVLLRLSE